VAVGAGAGYNLTTGSINDIILGDGVGTSGGLTTARDTIEIGTGLQVLPQTAYAQLDIGNLLFGTGLASTTFVSTGNIGIGTSSPSSRLTVWGIDTASTSAFAVVNSASTTEFNVLDNGNVGIGTTTPWSDIAAAGSLLDLTTNGVVRLTMHDTATTQEEKLSSDGTGFYIDSAGASTAANNNIVFRVSNTNSNYTTTEAMRITSAGNVGIGTTTPSARLSVTGSNTSASTGALAVTDSNNNPLFNVMDGGNLGIGTTTPNYLVHVVKNSPAATPFLVLENTSLNVAATADIDWRMGDHAVNNGFISDGYNGTTFYLAMGSGWPATETMRLVGGNLGIGTTTPYSRLSVWGPDTSAGTSAFVIANSASTTEFNVLDNGNATLAGTLTQNSDQRLKTNIQTLNASSSLAAIDALNPVTFNWINLSQGSTTQLGFIAQQVQQIFPNLVATTSPTALTPDGTLSLNYIGLISPIVAAIQALSAELNSIENTIAGFAQSFTTHILTADDITANNSLCVAAGANDPNPVCITKTQLATLLSQSAAAGLANPTPGSSTPSLANPTPDDATDIPPVIQINGDNPAIVQVGATYTDLGATITGPHQDLNLGITTYVNGTPMNPVQLDTTTAATDTIAYVATDQAGLTATTTRTVVVVAPDSAESPTGSTSTVLIEAAPSIVPSAAASTTEATSTAQ
jgi:hypothetical protein